MLKVTTAMLLCILAGCASTPPQDYSICATQPGSYACQIEQYRNTDS